jgi:hypothetical protein
MSTCGILHIVRRRGLSLMSGMGGLVEKGDRGGSSHEAQQLGRIQIPEKMESGSVW